MIDRDRFFAAVRARLFGGTLSQDQVDGTTAVLNEWELRKLTDLRWLAYMLATAKHETNATMQPVREAYYVAPTYEGAEAWRKTHLRYWPFYGRGLVQLTWLDNYRKMNVALAKRFPKLDLVAEPERACELDIAVAVMFEGMLKAETGIGDFTGTCIEQYFNATTDDAVNARRIINGTDRAQLIAGYHHDFLQALLQATGTTIATTVPEPAPKPIVGLLDPVEAIKRLQAKAGIKVDGLVGPATRVALGI